MPLSNEDSLKGFAFAATAYVLWGFLPFYLKAVAHIGTAEVLAHRVIWSLPLAGMVLWYTGRTHELRTAIMTPRMLGMAMVTATLVSVNWGTYVWAVANDHALDAALGYYINPLFSVFLGAVLLRERPSPLQMVAILLAATAVILLTWQTGRLPIVAVGLTLSWGFYGYFKKSLPVGPNQGFFLEVMLLSPLAVVYVIYLTATHQSHFLSGSPTDTWLLLFGGVATAGPLMIFANGAKMLRLSTLGVLQYIAPTMIFLIAVLFFGEPFGLARMISFPLIWAALILYTISILAQARRGR